MKVRLLVFLLAASLLTWAQGRGSTGRPAGTPTPPSGAGASSGMRPDTAGQPTTPGKPADAGKPADPGSQASTQQALKDSQINSGAFRMLQTKTGMTSEDLQALYTSSGARNFGAFTSALVVSKNLGLDQNAVLEGMKTQSLGKTLQSLGVSPAEAKKAEAQAKKEAKAANKPS